MDLFGDFICRPSCFLLSIHDNIEDVRNKAVDPDFSIDVDFEKEKNKESSNNSFVIIVTIILAIILSFVNLNRRNNFSQYNDSTSELNQNESELDPNSSNSYFDENSKKNLVITINGRKKFVADYDFERPMNWAEAKRACENLGSGWRLPNNEELKAMYEQLYQMKNGEFYLQDGKSSNKPSEYWSAIENIPGDNYEAYFFCFANGILQNTADANGRDKSEEYNVRAIRDIE